MNQDKKKLVPVNVAAQRSGYSERWIRELARRGLVDAENQGVRKTKVSPASLEAYRHGKE
jgi:hypothetical protein